MVHITANVIGVTGTFLCLLAYFLLQLNKCRPDGVWFLCLNLLGALFIMFSLFYFFNLASFLMEIAWSSISIYGLLRWWVRRQRTDNRG